MAKNRSDNSRFPSNKGGGWVSAAQYITECLCILIARQQKKQLGDQFWLNSPWDKIFKQQIPAAASLLKEYHPNVIIAALRDRRCWKIRSLRARYMLDPILKEKAAEQAVKDAAPVVIMEKMRTVQAPRQHQGKKSIIALLKEGDDAQRPD